MKKIFFLMIPLLAVVFSFIGNNSFTITGTITDSKGNPISYATVRLKGGSIATTSNEQGSYSLKVNTDNGTLVFAVVGYTSKEVKFNKQHVINVSLVQDTKLLTEVVVTGLGATRKQTYTGHVSGVVSTKSLRRDASVDESVLKDRTPLEYEKLVGDDKNKDNDGNDYNTEGYDHITENTFHKATEDPLSTFSIDVDAASYSNVRRYLSGGQLPPAGSVRIEEMINYFKYNYPQPTNGQPFSITTEMSDCPWNKENKLLLIGLQGKQIPVENLPSSNLVFLIDVSGSMTDENKLPLVKASLKLLTDQLREKDKISIVVYAGNAGLVLPATNGTQKQKIQTAIDALEAGGSTAGGAGIQLAYKIAKENFLSEGNNRVILCTDGDFNVGVSSNAEMVSLIEKERESGVFLTVLGYGMGNYQDSKMQELADKGNGNHAYIDGLNEARKVLINEFGGTLFTIAKDVKLQVEFNPAKIAGYRLIGYENRMLKKEDFKDDKKDAGELGSGHTVTALYEIIPAGVDSKFLKDIDPLKYQKRNEMPSFSSDEFLTVKFRYKEPSGTKSELIEHPLKGQLKEFSKTSDNFHFAAAVASFGMLLRRSEFRGTSDYKAVLSYCSTAIQNDNEGYRKEFITLVKKADELSGKTAKVEDGNNGK